MQYNLMETHRTNTKMEQSTERYMKEKTLIPHLHLTYKTMIVILDLTNQKGAIQMTIIMADKNKETNAVATGIVLSEYQKREANEITQDTFIKRINIDKVKSEVRNQRPVIEEQVGEKAFDDIISQVIMEYFSKSLNL